MDTYREAEKARAELADLARAMLANEISFIEGARRLWRLGGEAGLPTSHADLTVFQYIDSETDALPLGAVRNLWLPAALAASQPEIDEAEEWARIAGEDACRNLVIRFGIPSR